MRITNNNDNGKQQLYEECARHHILVGARLKLGVLGLQNDK
jgi:hypothetical protein